MKTDKDSSTRIAFRSLSFWIALLTLAVFPIKDGFGAPPTEGPAAFPPLSPLLPYDVDGAKVRALVGPFGQEDEGKILKAHGMFGTLVWQTFIALNWPADAHGAPDPQHGIGDNSQWRVWDYWRPASTVFE